MPYHVLVQLVGIMFKLYPALFHDAVVVLTQIIGEAIQLDQSGLHMAVLVKVVVFAFNGLPFGYNGFSVLSKVVPVGFGSVVVPFIFVGYAEPLVDDTFSVFIYIVLVHHGGAAYEPIFV